MSAKELQLVERIQSLCRVVLDPEMPADEREAAYQALLGLTDAP
jgi:hypothetical protein